MNSGLRIPKMETVETSDDGVFKETCSSAGSELVLFGSQEFYLQKKVVIVLS